jgi:hypothetical protein
MLFDYYKNLWFFINIKTQKTKQKIPKYLLLYVLKYNLNSFEKNSKKIKILINKHLKNTNSTPLKKFQKNLKNQNN